MKPQNRILLLICTIVLLFAFTSVAYADSPGTDGNGAGTSDVNFGSLLPVLTETGLLSLSIDGLGTINATGTIQVEKPAGATVRSAYLAAASTGFRGRVLNNGDIQVDGTGVNWMFTTPSSISSSNHWAEVTAIVKPTLDAAPAGRVDFTITEVSSSGIDGEVLAVIFDDPNQTQITTIVLAFGAQDVSGDTFAIALADPIDTSDAALVLDMSLGISFGAQGCASGQFSQIDVNGSRMTTSAGGEDDGTCANGALLTVGGLDDSNINPPPTASPSGPRTDDELYNLIPFVANGDTAINVFTRNPSNDDNIFFAALRLSGRAIVGEGILLTPLMATNPLNTDHTVMALVQDADGNAVTNRDVTFRIVSGPHAGLSTVAQTDSTGQATFTYRGTVEGTDTIEASFVSSQGLMIVSGPVTKNWRQSISAASIALTPPTATNSVNTEHCVTATVKDQNSDPMSGITVEFTVTGANATTGSGVTAASGEVGFCYTGVNAGIDTITATTGSLSATATKEWTPVIEEIDLENTAVSGFLVSRTPAPNAPAGVFRVIGTFKNVSDRAEFERITFRVLTLTNGNLLLNTDSGIAGGVGAELTVPTSAFGPDGILSPDESFDITFDIGLAALRGFTFLVEADIDLVGGGNIVAPASAAQVMPQYSLDFDNIAEDSSFSQTIYLPMVIR